MKSIFVLLVIFSIYSSYSQQLYFPVKNINDSLAVASSMTQLAKQIIKVYKNDDNEAFFDDLFRLEIVALEYKKSLATLNSFKNLFKNSNPEGSQVFGFGYQSYNEAKIYQMEKLLSFDEAYRITLSNRCDKLTESQINLASTYFDTEIQKLQDSFEKLLRERLTVDSISLENAKQVCRSYCAFNVYRAIIPQGKTIFGELENKLFVIEDSVGIQMNDGSTLQAVIVRNRKTKLNQPAILNFNIYSGSTDKLLAKTAAIHGYVGVVANTRGKGISAQNIEPFEHDASDAYDIINWISNQPWCNGKVGMYGGSYLGFSQWAATKKLHPALKTIIPQVSVGIGIDYPMENNVFTSYMLRWIHYVTNNKQTDPTEFKNETYWTSVFNKWYVSGTSFRSLDSIEGRHSVIFERWLQHPSHDSYWQNMVPYKIDFSKIDIPVLTITGYFDDDQLGAMYYYKEHLKYNKNANHTFLIGPYDHFGAQGSPASEWQGYKIDSVANVNINELLFKWFDFTLKDGVAPELLKDKVNYQLMGTNEWKHTSSISKMSNDTLLFYLSNIELGKRFKLLTHKPAERAYIEQKVNFLYRNDTVDFVEKILGDNIELGNYISFISDSLENQTIINGNFFGEIKNIINKKDYDLSIKLYELLPDGRYFNLSHFLGRASYAKDRSKRQLLTPGKEETIPYSNSFFTCKKLQKGSRLVVLVGVNKNKNWQVNYGTGKDVSNETILDGKIPLEIKWLNDSYIKIPVWRDE